MKKNNICFAAGLVFSLFVCSLLGAQEAPPENLNMTQMPALPDEFTLPADSAFPPEFVLDPQTQGAEPSEPASMAISNPSTQNKISLEIKGMDVVDVLKMLASRAGLNIVVGKNVVGRVTLFLKDVDTWDAFELILASNDLAYEKKGSIINVMTQRDYELVYGERYQDKKLAKSIQLKYGKAIDLSRALVQMKTNVGRVIVDEGSNSLVIIDSPEALKKMEDFIKSADLPLETRVFELNYASAEKLSPKLQESITKGLGTIKIDERTNKIVVTDYPAKIADIEKLIVAFDEKTPQVWIDAQIVQVSPSDLFQMGVDWDYWIKKYFEARASLPISAANTLFVGTASATTVTGKGDYKAVLDILRTIGDVKVLSSPRVMALNNQEAKIHVGTRDAYITSTTSQGGTGTTVTSQSVNFVDTGIQLYVTPTINRDGFVTMKIKPEISDSTRTDLKAEGQITQVPIVTTSEAETTVMVKDGVTIIIGGLRKDKREKTVRKIPILGDIPFVGFFFRSTSDSVTKSDLVILLTPHIMSGETSYTEIAQAPPREGAVVDLVKGKIVTKKFSESQQNLVADSQTSAAYIKLLYEKVKTVAFTDRPQGQKGEVKVAFSIASDGKLLSEPSIFSTTNASLSPFAVKAIKAAAPFPAFDKAINKPRETFRITLNYE